VTGEYYNAKYEKLAVIIINTEQDDRKARGLRRSPLLKEQKKPESTLNRRVRELQKLPQSLRDSPL